VKPLSTEDQRYLEAAQGWLILGDLIAADAELDNITPLFRVHPDVLGVRWHVYSKAQKWDAPFEIARFFVEQLPDDPFGWIHQAHQQATTDEPCSSAAWLTQSDRSKFS
jgi:hypothetical protein